MHAYLLIGIIIIKHSWFFFSPINFISHYPLISYRKKAKTPHKRHENPHSIRKILIFKENSAYFNCIILKVSFLTSLRDSRIRTDPWRLVNIIDWYIYNYDNYSWILITYWWLTWIKTGFHVFIWIGCNLYGKLWVLYNFW